MLSFSVSASASSSKVYNIKDDFELALFNEKGDALTGDRISLTTTQVNGVTYYRIYPKSLSDQSSFYSHSLRMVSALKLENLSLKTEYNIKVSFFTSQEYTFAVALNPGNGGESIILFTQDGKNNEIIDCNINFTLSELGLSSNNNLELVLFVIQNAEILGMSYYNFSDIVLTDLDDNSQFFDGIWGTIKHIFIAIVGGECSDGDFQSVGLFGKLAEGFSALGNKVSQLFTDFRNSWTSGINALKDKIESIQQWFVELGENIIEGIKSLFIPEDGYFESKKDELENFFSLHFGIVYTAGDLGISVIRKFTSLTPPANAVLHVPAWQMQLPWDNNKIITLVPAMDVNFKEHITNNGVLETFYNFYRAFITCVLIFSVVNYARHKFDYVFGKDGEGVS